MLVEITDGLVERGHDVTILMPKEGEVEFDIKAKLFKTEAAVLTESDFPESDVIVSNFYLTVPVSEEASVKGKGIHVRFSLCYEPMFLPLQNQTFPTYSITKNLIVISKYQQQLVEINHGIKGEIVPIGITPIFKNNQIRNSNEQLNISAVVRIPDGGYSWQRNQEYLLQTLEKLKVAMPDLHIVLICPPNELARSNELKEIKNKGLFTFRTPIDDTELSYHYNEADIFVASSIFEAGALPTLESMRCGAAVAAIYSGGNMDYAIHEQNCLLSYEYEKRLYDDILRLIQNESLRQSLARRGEEDTKTWTWEHSVEMFEQSIYKFMR